MKNLLDSQLKEALQLKETPLNQIHIQQTYVKAKQVLEERKQRQRIRFGAFLKLQIRFIGWKVWFIQGVILALICSVFVTTEQTLFMQNTRHITFFLCCLSILILLTAVPFIHKSVQYGMHEVELTTRFSSIRLLIAKLIIIGIGDFVILNTILLLIAFKTPLHIGSSVLYLLLPHLIAAYGLLYLLGHMPIERFWIGSIVLSYFLLIVLVLLNRLYPRFYLQTFSVGWAILCLGLLFLCVIQLRHIMTRSAYVEIQF
ncbi:MAG: hypothetical protein E7231_06465 [Cellulosilyticum sp.]|nr:hypothetical protein [Cellulosilyticum sp.]